MAGYFFGGVFSTPVGQQIARATDNAASAGDLQLHLDICDAINETDNGPKDAVAALRKRITSNLKNFHVINLSLTVLETTAKNCGIRFHSRIAQKDFLQDLMKIINQKNNPPTIVKERVLGLIQQWADAFRANPQLSAVVEFYNQLKQEGVEFPAQDLDNMAPINTPDRTSADTSTATTTTTMSNQSELQLTQASSRPRTSPTPQQAGLGGNPSSSLSGTQQAKVLSEIDVVQRNIDVMNEILIENEPGKEEEGMVPLMEELNAVTRKMQERVTELVGRIQESDIMVTLLGLNDSLNALFIRYDRYMKNRQAVLQGGGSIPVQQDSTDVVTDLMATTDLMTTTNLTPTASTTSAAAVEYPSLDDEPPPYQPSQPLLEPLIDLSTDPATSVTQPDLSSQLADLGLDQPPTTTGPPANNTLDEFDIFAQSRQAYSNTSGSTYDDGRISMDANLADAVQGKPLQSTTEQTLASLDEWLNITDLNVPPSDTASSVTKDESATSAEFDQFLAQRVNVGTSLPPARTKPQMQKAEEQSDELFAL
ncbi:TOM1-like protein 2 [Dysidea avara]|uniref:TOM1-like protein 2 n=1 Tax=Dysidea avara TaxID=196820 RepID=UPI00332D73A2